MTQTLVTGGNGFIGRHLVAALAARGEDILLLQRRAGASVDGAETVMIDAFTADAVAKALQGRKLRAVYHLAAYGVTPGDRDPAAMFEVNVTATLALIRASAAAGASHAVLAGSSAEYAPDAAARARVEADPLESERLYGASKAAAGIAAQALGRGLGIAVGVGRLFNVYGSGEAPHRLLPSLKRAFSTGTRVPLSAGTQVRDFVHVDDAVSGLLAIGGVLTRDGMAASGAYNIASGTPTSVRSFVQLAADVAKAPPALLGFGEIPMRPDDLPWLVGDSKRLRDRASWRPKIGLSDGLAEVLRRS